MKSPDNKHIAVLALEGEIRFGPGYFSLRIDDRKIKDRIFGEEIKWSADSQYLATQEWLTTDYQEGPITRVILFDVLSCKLSEFKVTEKGFTENFIFEDGKLIYQKHYYGSGAINEFEVDITTIKNWKEY